jgi:glycosyltransferase involved in cell wall biosynthesis
VRVVAIVEHFPPRMGSDRRIYELLSRLSERHEVRFLCLPSFRELNGMMQVNASNNSPFLGNDDVRRDVIVHRVGIPNALRRSWEKSMKLAYVLSMVLLVFRVFGSLKRIRPQVVVLNYPSVYTGILGFFASKFLRTSCVVDFNDLIAQYTIELLNMKKSSLQSRLIVWIQDFIVKNSEAVIAPTSYIRRYALMRGVKDERISVIPNGVDLRVFHRGIESDLRSKLKMGGREVCLYFGRFDEWAGAHMLRQLGSIFEQKRPDARFLLVGGGSAQANFAKNTVLINEVPHNKVPEVIAIADVVLVPFPENEVSHAASPLKLFEAMAMGKPLVASSVSGIEEVIENGCNGLLASPSNLEEWVNAVETILDSKQLQAELGDNAHRCVRKYDWNLLALQLEDVFLKSTGQS